MSASVVLEAEFEAIAELKKTIAEQTAEIDEEITRLQALKMDIAGPSNILILEHTENIQRAILDGGKSFKCPFGKATYRKEYERASWDSKALTGYAAAHPEIEQFKKITIVEASVSISVGGQE